MWSNLSHADWRHIKIGYMCDIKKDIAFGYLKGEINQAGLEMLKNLKVGEWELSSLIETEDSQVTGIKTIQKECKLSDGVVTIIIEPFPGNYRLGGRCGAGITAKVYIRKGGEFIFQRLFEDPCKGPDENSLSKIGYSAKNKSIFTEPYR